MTAIPRIDPRGGEFLVALIAHDQKKDEMLELAREHRTLLSRLRLLAERPPAVPVSSCCSARRMTSPGISATAW